ncbi:MAG: acyl carrier protein [Bacteroidetes bacterium]|nr:acyl carrier protein [Bacteroidota bacterium]
MSIDEVKELVNEFLIEEFELEESQLLPDALMKDDLDIESLDFVDIAVIIEKEFRLKVKSEDIEKIIKLEDLYNYIFDHTQN